VVQLTISTLFNHHESDSFKTILKPFASLPNFVTKECKRVLINRERVGNFKFNDPSNKTDAFYKGNADDGCLDMALSFGFEDEMKKSFEELKNKISNNNNVEKKDVEQKDKSEH
jgi:NAD-dependent histone deacetylase SIR2